MQLFLLQKQALLGKKIVSLALHDVLFFSAKHVFQHKQNKSRFQSQGYFQKIGKNFLNC